MTIDSFDLAGFLKREASRKANRIEKPDREDTMIFAKLLVRGDEKELSRVMDNHVIHPSSKLSVGIKQKILDFGEKINDIYYLPYDTPVNHSFGIPIHDVRSKNYLVRDEDKIGLASIKGRGTAYDIKDIVFGIDEKTGMKLLLRGALTFKPDQHSNERKLWGGGQLPTLRHALETIQLINKEIEKAKNDGDPAFSMAKTYGCNEPQLIKPIGIFQPLQMPIAIDVDKFGHAGDVTPLSINEKTKELLMKIGRKSALTHKHSRKDFTYRDSERIIKVNLREVGEILGIPSSFMDNYGIMGYTSPLNTRLWKIKKFNNITKESALSHTIKFAASQGLMIHILQNRLNLSSGSIKSGSILTPQNVGIGHDLSAIYHDFDSIRPKNWRDALSIPKELAMARNSVLKFANALGIPKSDTREAVQIMTRIAKGARE